MSEGQYCPYHFWAAVRKNTHSVHSHVTLLVMWHRTCKKAWQYFWSS